VSTPAFAQVECRTLTIADAAALLGIHRQTLRAAIERGDLRAIRIGRRWLVPVAAINELLEGRRGGA
jgi:excisionase family DNA binding protein